MVPSLNPSTPSAQERAQLGYRRLVCAIYGQPSLKSFLWTGVESGNPLTRDESYRWDSLDDQGLLESERRRQRAKGPKLQISQLFPASPEWLVGSGPHLWAEPPRSRLIWSSTMAGSYGLAK